MPPSVGGVPAGCMPGSSGLGASLPGRIKHRRCHTANFGEEAADTNIPPRDLLAGVHAGYPLSAANVAGVGFTPDLLSPVMLGMEWLFALLELLVSRLCSQAGIIYPLRNFDFPVQETLPRSSFFATRTSMARDAGTGISATFRPSGIRMRQCVLEVCRWFLSGDIRPSPSLRTARRKGGCPGVYALIDVAATAAPRPARRTKRRGRRHVERHLVSIHRASSRERVLSCPENPWRAPGMTTAVNDRVFVAFFSNASISAATGRSRYSSRLPTTTAMGIRIRRSAVQRPLDR